MVVSEKMVQLPHYHVIYYIYIANKQRQAKGSSIIAYNSDIFHHFGTITFFTISQNTICALKKIKKYDILMCTKCATR